MKHLAKRRLLTAFSRYDQQVEPLQLKLNSSTDIKPYLLEIFHRLEQAYSGDPELMEKIKGFRNDLRSLRKKSTCLFVWLLSALFYSFEIIL